MEQDIKALWDRGLTMSQIARELGVTTNVIAGKISRSREMFSPRTARERFISRPSKAPEGILALKIGTCRYITNDDTSKPVYCMKPVERRAYCEHHASLCYLPRRQKDD